MVGQIVFGVVTCVMASTASVAKLLVGVGSGLTVVGDVMSLSQWWKEG